MNTDLFINITKPYYHLLQMALLEYEILDTSHQPSYADSHIVRKNVDY